MKRSPLVVRQVARLSRTFLAAALKDSGALMPAEPQLSPLPTKGHFSVARLTGHWYVVCRSRALGRRPRAVTLLDTPLVLFRTGAGKVAALLDRCPHRNVPLS